MKKKVIVVGIMIAIVVIILSSILSYYIVKNSKIKSNGSQLAIMVQNDNDNNYHEWNKDIWPIDNYYFSKSECANDTSINWDQKANALSFEPGKSDNCKIYFNKKENDFEFKEEIQEFVAPATGTYKLEVWGAQGGTNDSTKKGGLGGYSTGTVYLEVGEKLYVVVGGQGSTTESNGIYKGGYNGGGDGFTGTTLNQYAYGGGGATHIAKSEGVLSSLSDKKTDVLIVAGGGGGNGGGHKSEESIFLEAYGGAGGGDNGLNGYDQTNKTNNGGYTGTGGTQQGAGSSPKLDSNNTTGSFGKGGNATSQPYGGAGGGGGYYGGSQSSRGHAGGGGGSGFVNSSLVVNGKTIAGDSLMPSTDGGQETGHAGNGYARITLVNVVNENIALSVDNFEPISNVQTFTAPETGFYKIELWGAQGGNRESYQGGKGGYTTGIISLKANEKLYVYVGGSGSKTDKGGYNGGSDLTPGQSAFGASGGGATDVRLTGGNWNDFTSLKSRIMVAGGGGGANNRNISIDREYWYGAGNGGYGGGLVGGDGQSIDNKNPETDKAWGWTTILGGSQTSGGKAFWNSADRSGINIPTSYAKFGYSTDQETSGTEAQSTGGGGYYGGGSGTHSGGGGGSSYISGYLGCVAISSASSENSVKPKDSCTEENAKNNISCSYHYSGRIFSGTVMKAGNEQMPNPKGGTEIGHSGHGYARISLIITAE